ncbi:hypothetical protein [Lyngbya sp. CCY1209]|uniref:hypothetical protein n=1 Tax=Lyngbya sp. CCY1209 TaxID=2886103 RepID=UPI002D2039C9|nr:hypothetical protein [Lyngbya sp. CCY1209]MEB3884037.1 hypothetical protein [Lyngbya sp. CCY1209]
MFVIESIAESILFRTRIAVGAIAQFAFGLMRFEQLEQFVVGCDRDSFIGRIANVQLTQRDEYIARHVPEAFLDSLYSDPE